MAMTESGAAHSKVRWVLIAAACAFLGLCSAIVAQDGAPEAAPIGADGEMPRASQVNPADAEFSGGLLGSKHDFSESGQFGRDLCTPCHTPHIPARAVTRQAGLRVVRSGDAAPRRGYQAFEMTLNASSLLCLSCHDGVVATDVFAGAHAMSWSEASQRGARAQWLTSHPVGIRYPAGREDYHSAAAVVSDGRLRLPDGRIQCTTCHDPHNSGRHGGMLWTSNERSRLCLSCHRL